MALDRKLFTASIFSEDDISFLEGIFERFPEKNIKENFERYLAQKTPREKALRLRIDSEKIPRSGWVRRGIKDPETLSQHMGRVINFSTVNTPEKLDTYHTSTMLCIHDTFEVIATDFTPHDKISTEDKHRLELLAAKTLYWGGKEYEKCISMITEFMEQKTPESIWAHDIDKIDPCFVALQYEAIYPEQAGLFKEFADYALKKLKTEKGKEILNDLIANKESEIEYYKENPHKVRNQKNQFNDFINKMKANHKKLHEGIS